MQCPALPRWDDIIFNTSATSIGTVVNITCLDDVSFVNMMESMVTTCGDDGEWTPSVPDCASKSGKCGSIFWWEVLGDMHVQYFAKKINTNHQGVDQRVTCHVR